MFFPLQTESAERPPLVSVCVAWVTFACAYVLTQTAPAALNSKPAAAVLSAATVAASAAAVLYGCGNAHAVYSLFPVLVAAHSMVPTHVAVSCFATAAVVAVHVTSLLTEVQWTPNAQHVKQVRLIAGRAYVKICKHLENNISHNSKVCELGSLSP